MTRPEPDLCGVGVFSFQICDKRHRPQSGVARKVPDSAAVSDARAFARFIHTAASRYRRSGISAD